MYAPNNRVSKPLKQKLIKLGKKIDKSTIRVGDFNTPLSAIDSITRQEIIGDTEELNIINQQNVIVA